jgi:SAM-dependent methyltransferase
VSELKDKKTEAVAEIIRMRVGPNLARILVVGCGDGIEAAILAQRFSAEVVGIDTKTNFHPIAKQICNLTIGDATALEFEDESFDLIYSYHVIEHIPDVFKALQEMNRVLKHGGHYWIGTPNRDRLIGYLGSKRATLAQKIKWNAKDWRARATGRFRNECGAHAGFVSTELAGSLYLHFGDVDSLTNTYYQAIYPHRPMLIEGIIGMELGKYLFPALYFMGKKA